MISSHGAIHLTLAVGLFQGFSFVVQFLATAEPHQHLRATFCEIHSQRDQRQPFFFGLTGKLGKLAAMDQQLARSGGDMIHAVGLDVFLDVTIHQPEFAIPHASVGLVQRELARAQALDFAADQCDAAFQRFQDIEPMTSLTVLGNQFVIRVLGLLGFFGDPFFLGHSFVIARVLRVSGPDGTLGIVMRHWPSNNRCRQYEAARDFARVLANPRFNMAILPQLTVLNNAVHDDPLLPRRLPPWLRRQIPTGNANHATARILQDLRLETVCENAKCPNRMECYSQKTATFMILGNVCTRPCGFCSVDRGRPALPEQDEPQRVAEAAQRLGLRHVVITSVTRDDLPDGGADHFYRCVLAVRAVSSASVEVLTPDFVSCKHALSRVIASAPEVFNHNTETVPRLYRQVRGPKSDYGWTLEMLRRVKQLDPQIKTKSGLMLGLGETRDELLDVLADLRECGCDFLTLGQYLRPATDKYLPVARYITPDEFAELGRLAKALGFQSIASGPFVRSSYHAREMAEMY